MPGSGQDGSGVGVEIGVAVWVGDFVMVAAAVAVFVGMSVAAGVLEGSAAISDGAVGAGWPLLQATKIDTKSTPSNAIFTFDICFPPVTGNKSM